MTGSMETSGFDQGAALLQNGQVLVAGGKGPAIVVKTLASAELYNPATGVWTFTGSMNDARATQAAAPRRSGPDGGRGNGGGGRRFPPPSASTAELYSNGSRTLRCATNSN